jgi:DNA-binding IclR family transcriptional regulator
VEQDRRTKRYKLTLKLMQLGGMVQRRVRLLTQIRPYLCRLTQLTRESTALAVVTQNKEVIIVDQVNFPDEISPMPTLGLEKPLHCTAAGKALLAALPEEEAREALKGRELVRYTEKTISSLPALVRQLRAFRSQGYAQEDEEYELGVRGVASAIRKRGGDVVAIIEIRAPSVRLTRERLSELGKYVRLAAREISLGLGYKPCAQD